jgi:signal transduction histidine kinase
MERKLRTANDTTKIIILNNLSILCFSSTAKSEYYANKALMLSKKIKNQKYEAYTLIYTFSYIYILKNNYRKLLECAKKELQISKAINYETGIALANYYIGTANCYMGNNDSALIYFNKSLTNYRKLKSNDTIKIYYFIGFIYYSQKNYEKSLTYFLTALKKEKENGSYYTRLNGYIGDVYKDWGRYKEALGYYKKIIEVSLKSGDKLVAAYNMNRAGEIYLKTNEYKSANEYATKALEILSNLRDSSGIQYSMNILGNTYKKQKQYGKAFYYLKRATGICQRINYQQQVSDNLFSIGELYFETKDYNNAIENFNSSLEISKKLKLRSNIFKNYQALSKIYLAKGNYKEAYKYEQLYTSVKDSVFNENINKQITEIQTKFETEKKEKEILRLTKEKELKDVRTKRNIIILVISFLSILIIIIVLINLLRQKLEKRRMLKRTIETEEKERKRFAEDLHDGLGPLLSTIGLYVNEFDSAKNDEPKKQEIIKYTNELIDEAVNSTRMIARNITPGTVSETGIFNAVQTFCYKVNVSNYVNINITSNDKEKRYDSTVEIILYRVLLELINNTIKHAKAKNINIEFKAKEKSLNVLYTDDGKGFDYKKTINDPKKGMGLNNIINRISSINGVFEYTSKPGEGANVKIEIHSKSYKK